MTQADAPLPMRVVRVAVVSVLASFGMVTAFATMAPSGEAEIQLSRATQVDVLSFDHEKAVLPSPERYVREETFRRGDTLAGFLSRLSVDEPDRSALVRLPALRVLRPGSTVLAEVSDSGRLLSMDFVTSQDARVTVSPGPDGFTSQSTQGSLELRTVMKTGAIRSSLFAATDAADIPDAVASQLADVFSGDIDFHRDLRKDDRFTLVYELRTLAGRPVRSGRLLAAEFVNQGKRFRAVYYKGADGKGAYYAPDGRSLRKAFLRSPLEFSRVTSGFGLRMHPILNSWRAHKGIDYGAPTGTRVRAVSDGIVAIAGRQGGYGNMVVLRHTGAFSTAYGHLSGFAKGLKPGMRVSQGDVIGFVGATGWATGPHLHYEFRVGGEARNPVAVALPPAQPIPANELAAYRSHAAALVARLDMLGSSQVAALGE